jgi:YidC/Oxa1 family membrane protein insertase
MDKIGKLGVLLSILVLVAWQFYSTQTMREARQAQEQQASAAPAASLDPSAASQASPPAVALISKSRGPVFPPESKQSVTLQSPGVTWQLSSHGGGIEKVSLQEHLGEGAQPVSLNEFGNIPIGALTESYETPILDSFAHTPSPDGTFLEFKRLDSRNLETSKKFSIVQLPGPKNARSESYQMALEISFTNRSSEPLTVPSYFLRAGSNAPLHIKDLPMYTSFNRMLGNSSKAADTSWFDGGGFLGFGKQPRPVYSENGEIKWVGVTSQYYCTILTATGNPGIEALASRFTVDSEAWKITGRNADGQMPYAMDGALRLAATGLEPGKTLTRAFTIYAGPREFSRLQDLKAGQEEMLDFGYFSFVSRILLSSMKGLNGLMGSYAAAIVVLTILIKAILWPIQNKATASMKKMQEIQPKLTALREKYSDNPQRLNEEMLHLYKKHGVNPASGCFPMFLQIPIFFGFYNMLGKAVELRNSPFLWVNDLSQPDTIAYLAGFPVNVLPLLMAGTMLWQMQLTPKTGDPTQQRIFMIMPLVFIAFCYNFASALSLYWTVQNVFSILQLVWTNRQNKAGLQKAALGGK